MLDRIVGYDLSGLIWKKVRYGLSAGRVQSPALRIIVEREKEIRAFKPETYWNIKALLQTDKKEIISFTCINEPRDKEIVEKIVKEARSGDWKINSVDTTEVNRSPRAPFITSTLQQTASSRLGFSPSRTMSIAQKLYEAGYITYMRTDSTNLSKEALGQIAHVVEKEYGKNYLQIRTYATKSKNAQEAHEAIRPTHMGVMNAGHTDEQKRLYRMIWQRTIASQMTDAKNLRTKAIANIDKGDIPDFVANGSQLIFKGWLVGDPDAEGEEINLPNLEANQKLNLNEIIPEEKQTTPPPRYTEAGLVKELEKRGIGRPSTYASIVKTIEDRGYVEKEGRSLKSTDTGEVVSDFLTENFSEYTSDTFTAQMENELDEIANGEREYEKTLLAFYKPFHSEVEAKTDTAKITTLGEADPKFVCPICKSGMNIKLGRTGKFLSCSKYPDCSGALMIDGTELPKDKSIGTDPKTNLEIFVKVGRFGPYVQLGEKTKENKKPRMASIPKEIDPGSVNLEQALTFLSLPRELGNHPETGLPISASRGRFGPYIVHNGDFRSLKTDDVYTIGLERAIQILSEPKPERKRGFKAKTKKKI